MIADPIFWLIAAVIVIYGVLQIGLALALRPKRLQMVKIANDLIADKKLTSDDRDMVIHMIDTCTSFIVSAAIPIALIYVAFGSLLGAKSKATSLEKDLRFCRLTAYYFASVLASNLVFATASIAVLIACIPIFALGAILRHKSLRQIGWSVEESAWVASRAVPGHSVLIATEK